MLSETKHAPRLQAVLLSVCLAFFVVGCDNTDTNLDGGGVLDGLVDAPVGDVLVPDGPPAAPTFVRIDDKSPDATGEDPGADIDAVLLVKAGSGTIVAASIVAKYENPSLAITLRKDPNDALGNPDAFPDYPDLGKCIVDQAFVGLGGPGGYLIVAFAQPIETGDTIEVYEVGDCNFGAGTAKAEPITVSIGTSVDGPWTELGADKMGPKVSVTAP